MQNSEQKKPHKKRVQVWDGKKSQYRYRLVMEKHLGRPLEPNEVVHHINGDPTDDRIENLTLCVSNATHITTHHNHTYDTFVCETCGKEHKGEKRRKHHFCSRECWKKANKTLGGCPPTHGKAQRRTYTCEHCKQEFAGKRPDTKRLFCSQKCYWSWMKGKSKDEIHT
jgi:endogenous inhibitor of DNA gyrase (YacG/DUF329 family)